VLQVAPAVDKAVGRLNAAGFEVRRKAALDQRVEVGIIGVGHDPSTDGVSVERRKTVRVRAPRLDET